MTDYSQYRNALEVARELAAHAASAGDIPVGAVVIDAAGKIVGAGFNRREQGPEFDPTAHAEVVALRAAASTLGRWRLQDCTLVVTLEPCTMCAGAALNARIGRIVFGAWDAKAGACGSVRDVARDARLNHRPEVIGGVDEAACATQLTEFFANLRTGEAID